MNRKPADHAVWKKSAAIQFSLKEGESLTLHGKGGNAYEGTSKGCVFVAVAAASAEGERKYDWDKKITIALSEHEISQFMLGMKGKEVSFVHDQNMKKEGQGETIKTMRISPAKDGKELIYVNVSEKIKGEDRKLPGVSLTPAEALGIYTLLQAALPKVLGWDQ